MLTYRQLELILEKKVEEWQKTEKQPVGEVLNLLDEGVGDYIKRDSPPQDVVSTLIQAMTGQEAEELRRFLSNPQNVKEYDLWMLLSEMHRSSLD